MELFCLTHNSIPPILAPLESEFLSKNRNVTLSYDDELVENIASRCIEVESGARNVDNILTNTLLPDMSKELLSRMAAGEQLKEVKVSLSGEGFGFVIE